MISRLKIKNFKSIGDPGVDLELKPLTLLVGPNGGGKSSVLEAIAFISAECGFTDLLEYNRRYTGYPEIIHRFGPQAEITFYPNAYGGRYEVIATGSPRLVYLNNNAIIPETDERGIETCLKSLRQEVFSKVALLSSVRGFVEATKSFNEPPNSVGVRGEQLLPLLSFILGSGKYHLTAQKVTRWASNFGLPELRAGPRRGNEQGADYKEPILEVQGLQLATASSGARQILCVITEIFWRPARSIVLIEEPEISLHPEAQVKLVGLFAEAIKEQKQIVATTHSYFLPRAIVGAVQKKELDVEAVAIYEIEKEPEIGTVAKRLELDEKGNIKRWIPSFDKVEKRLFKEWWKTVPRE